MDDRYIEFKSGKMYYYIEGEGPAIVFLHGWGQSFATFKKITDFFSASMQIIGIDFLGFGKSDEPSYALSIDDYSNQLKQLLVLHNVEDPIIVGHSFGCRVAMRYASENSVKALCLVSSAGIKKRNLKNYYKVYKYKVLKKLYRNISKTKYEHLVKNSGSTDYQNASNVMKQTLSKVVNFNSKKNMKLIKAPTYLLWGIADNVTPYINGIKMHKLIKDSKLITFYNSGHFCYLQEEQKFIATIDKIIRG